MGTLLLGARLLIAVVFLVASVAKLADRRGSRKAIIDFGLPAALAPALGILLPLGELAVALALIPATTAWWGTVWALALLLVFMLGIGVNLARGRAPDCHCFGQLHSEPVGWRTIARNGVLAALASWLVWRGSGNVGPSVTGWLGSLTVAQLVGLTGASLVLAELALGGWFLMHLLRQNGRLLVRMEALEVRVAALDYGPVRQPAPAAPVAGLPVGSPAPVFRLPDLHGNELGLEDFRAAGKAVLLVFSDPGCGPCQALMPDVARWQRSYDARLKIAVISRGTPEQNRPKGGKRKLRRVLLQKDREVAGAYQSFGTPAAVLVDPDGRIGSPLAMGADAIADLVERVTGNKTPLSAAGVNGRHGHAHHEHRPSAPLRSFRPPPSIPVGQPAPALSLPDLDGKTVSLADFRGRSALVLFWNPGCGFCARMLDDLRTWEASPPEGVPSLLVVSTGPAETNRAMGLRSPIVLDEGFAAGRSFGASGTPSAVLIDAEGRIASEVAVGAPAVLALVGAEPAHAAPTT
jgi:peroxiredoxin